MTIQIKRVGRALSPIRPGAIVKEVLMGREPLITYEGEKLVKEACIVDLHTTYKEKIKQENQLRDKKHQLRCMVYDSFCHYFKFARYLHLVEFVREEPMIFPPPHGHLYQIGKHNGTHVRISKRRVFKLTDLGIQDERAWTDLCTAYKERWELPQKVEYLEPYRPPHIPKEERITTVPTRPKRREPIEIVPDEFPERPPVEEWSGIPSVAEYAKLVDHLKTLQGIGLDKPEVKRALKGLVVVVGDWSAYIVEEKMYAEKKKNLELFWRYKNEEKILDSLFDVLEGNRVGDAVVVLGRLVTERSKHPEVETIRELEVEEPELDEDELLQYRNKAQKFIVNIKNAIDETKKTVSIRRIKKIIDGIDTEIIDNELITGLDDLTSAIEDYEGIEREGLTAEEYKDEKESAFESIAEAVDGLEVADYEEHEVEEEPEEIEEIKEVKEPEIRYARPYVTVKDKDGKITGYQDAYGKKLPEELWPSR